MENTRVKRGGKVAVLYSPSYGAGWSTWESTIPSEIMLFCPRIVEWVESGKREPKEKILAEVFGEEEKWPYDGGMDDLEIEWLDEGTSFDIDEYDGLESVRVAPTTFKA